MRLLSAVLLVVWPGLGKHARSSGSAGSRCRPCDVQPGLVLIGKLNVSLHPGRQRITVVSDPPSPHPRRNLHHGHLETFFFVKNEYL